MNTARLMNIAKWLLLVGTVAAVFGFSTEDRRNAYCRSMDVNIEHLSGVYFIDESSIIRKVFDLGVPIIGEPLEGINLQAIRNSILELPSVRDAQVYTRIDGRLVLSVQQRRPLFRVIAANHPGYYIDTEGNPMPLSDRYSARVPVVTGSVPPTLEQAMENNEHPTLAEAFHLVQFIENNPFWSAQTEHIIALPSGEFELVPRVGGARIAIGSTALLENKFERLSAFYLKMATTSNLNKYKRINLKYRDQVVCERFF
jgi:cell division protein FtsQ